MDDTKQAVVYLFSLWPFKQKNNSKDQEQRIKCSIGKVRLIDLIMIN